MRQTLFLPPHKIVQRNHYPTSSCNCQPTHAHAASESVHLVNDEQRLIVWNIVVWSGAIPVKSWRGAVGKMGREVPFRRYSGRTWRMCGAYCTPRRLRGKSVSNTCAGAKVQPCRRRYVRPRDCSNHGHSGLVAPERHLRGDALWRAAQWRSAACKAEANARAGRRNPAKRSGRRGNGRRSGAGSEWRRAHEALCTTRVAREPWISESVQLHRFSANGKRNHSKNASSRPAVTKWPSKCGAKT